MPHLFAFGGCDSVAHAGIDLVALDPLVEGLRHAADPGSDGFNGGPQREVPNP